MTQLQRQKTDKEDVREITIINTIIILAIIITFLTSININHQHSYHHHQEIKREEMRGQMVVDSCVKSANLRQGKRGK